MKASRVQLIGMLTTIAIARGFCQDVDSVTTLPELVVQAFAQDRPIVEAPVSIGYRTAQDFAYFNNTSVLSVANTVPGVRMEERSPGSYRFSIRGSLLRSPFGVRNVKVYWNGLPFTDAGGNTYLNLLDAGGIGSMEIIKGPGASLYGAGTGGVLLLNSRPHSEYLSYHFQVGSYGQRRVAANGKFITSARTKLDLTLSVERADGYRQQAAMGRVNAGINGHFAVGRKGEIGLFVLMSGLSYETPGGLTLAQFNADPRQARPPAGTQPGAVEQQAAVSNSTNIIGSVYSMQWTEQWKTRLGAIFSNTTFENPSIRNVEERGESTVGLRFESMHSWHRGKFTGRVTWGGEYLFSPSTIDVYDNNLGTKGNIQTSDEVIAQSGLTFAQLEMDFPAYISVTVGGSMNSLSYRLDRTTPTATKQTKDFRPEFSPRVAILKRWGNSQSLFATVSSGFSPPGIAEVRPSTNNFNPDLNSERGINIETGVKGLIAPRGLYYELATYQFQLTETIVIQRTADGAEYFVNAGSTRQRGIEAYLSWEPIRPRPQRRVRLNKAWMSYTYQHYRFRDYVNDGIDNNGNDLTGVPPVIATAGADLRLNRNMNWICTLNFTDHIPLNDANSAYAGAYILLGSRLNYRFQIKRYPVEVFAGIDNLLNEKYSLGNDLNAFGGRFYNAAAPRNYFLGLQFKLGQ